MHLKLRGAEVPSSTKCINLLLVSNDVVNSGPFCPVDARFTLFVAV